MGHGTSQTRGGTPTARDDGDRSGTIEPRFGRNDDEDPIVRVLPVQGLTHQVRTLLVHVCAPFAGVEIELFFLDKTQMLFGDAKAVIGEVVDESTRLPVAAAVA
jgi:hypothetical protein